MSRVISGVCPVNGKTICQSQYSGKTGKFKMRKYSNIFTVTMRKKSKKDRMQLNIKNSNIGRKYIFKEIFVGGEKLTTNLSCTPVFSFPCFMCVTAGC